MVNNMGQDITGFIEIYNFNCINTWDKIVDIDYVNRSYSSFAFLGGRRPHNGKEITTRFVEYDDRSLSVDLSNVYGCDALFRILYPIDILNYDWNTIVVWIHDSLEADPYESTAYDALSKDFKSLFEMIMVLAKHHGQRNVRMIYAFD